MRWSSYQEAIFNAVSDGQHNLVVQARAGSAKTTTIVEAVNRLPQYDTLVVAFNKPIAEELRAKIASGIDVATLHSYGRRAIVRVTQHVQLENRRTLLMIKQRFGNGLSWRFCTAVTKTISSAKNRLVQPNRENLNKLLIGIAEEQLLDVKYDEIDGFGKLAAEILNESAKLNGIIDFDDMIWLPSVLDLKTWEYNRVFVDEAQDLNAAQLALVMKAKKSNGTIVAVGDRMQAIYEWRGADPAAMDRIRAETSAIELPLPICYRCPINVVRLAQETVPDIQPAPDAEEGFVEFISKTRLLELARPGDLVLSRTNAAALGVCLNFLSNDVPANIRGRDIGQQLITFIRRGECHTVDELLEYVNDWADQERAKLEADHRPSDHVTDRKECVWALCDGLSSVFDVIQRVERLFSDDDGPKVWISTVHRAKGTEADRVFILKDTFWHLRAEKKEEPVVLDKTQVYWLERRQEEERIWYVAVTRAKRELYLVHA